MARVCPFEINTFLVVTRPLGAMVTVSVVVSLWPEELVVVVEYLRRLELEERIHEHEE